MFLSAMTPDVLRETPHGCEVVIAVDPALTTATDEASVRATDQLLEAAGRSGPRRLILVTGLDDASADFGTDAPRANDGRPIEWLVIRTGSPYGIGDDPVTQFMLMMRSLPAVPLLPQSRILLPVWHEDLARCIATAVSLPADRVNRSITVTGPEAVTSAQLYDRIAALTDRHPAHVPVPELVTSFGKRLARVLSTEGIARVPPLSRFAVSADVRPHPDSVDTCDSIAATPLDQGLRRVIHELPELTPSEGVGTLERKTFSTVIKGSSLEPESLMTLVREQFGDLLPVPAGVEPVAPERALRPGAVLTLALPGRGHVAIRVVDVQPTQTVVATLRGHLLAGIVRFRAERVKAGLLFEVMTCDRAANPADRVGLTLGGARAQNVNWRTFVTNVAQRAGGHAGRARRSTRALRAEEARAVDEAVADLVRRHHSDWLMPSTSSGVIH
jgi:NADH dehydrogenase